MNITIRANTPSTNLLFLLAIAPMGIGACESVEFEDPCGSAEDETDSEGDAHSDEDYEGPSNCVAYGDLSMECHGELDGLRDQVFCFAALSYYQRDLSPHCISMFEELVGCLSTLTCEELDARMSCGSEQDHFYNGCF